MIELADYGLTPRWSALAMGVSGVLGRVVRQDRGFVQVVTKSGVGMYAAPARRVGVVVVGDWVVVENETVAALLERQSILSRQDAFEAAPQYLAANVDLVFVVCGADRPLKARKIERAVTQSWEAGTTPVVVLTKADLLEDASATAIELSEEAGLVEVIPVSSFEGNGLDHLRSRMHDKTSVLLGESGAGKSTLVNALLEEDVAQTGGVRAVDSKGRHTTTRRELYLLPGGGALIDTPGIRSLGLWADADSVDTTFSDVVAMAVGCRFRDCAHDSEPGCAVRDAADSGLLSVQRLESYRQQMKEVASEELRRNEHEKRQQERKFGRAVDEALRAKGKR